MTNSDHTPASAPKPLSASAPSPLKGEISVPGDKSISHRAIMFSSLAVGHSRVTGLLEGEDVLNTIGAMRQLGAGIECEDDTWLVRGCGVGALQQPDAPIDYGNAGTGVRLLMGIITGHEMTVRLQGDASLSRRPMGRVLTPLRSMGLVVDGDRETLPMTIRGTTDLIPIEYELPVPSAQVKSAVLIAGLFARGQTTVLEREATRDHTERMLRYFGADVKQGQQGALSAISVTGEAELEGRHVVVPGDPSSAAFIAAAATLIPESNVLIRNVLVNETRIGFYTTLIEMGADITFENRRDQGGEPVADVRIGHSELRGVTVPADRAPSMIDEYPILAVVAARASGETRMQGLAELRVKESDRLEITASGLTANGVSARIEGDDLLVTGASRIPGGATVKTELDHRIAMTFLILSLVAEQPVIVDDSRVIATSFKEFTELMSQLGVMFSEPAGAP